MQNSVYRSSSRKDMRFLSVMCYNGTSSQFYSVADIPNLKKLLAAVPEAEIQRLREGLKAVKKHFVLNQPPKRCVAEEA
jgi:hypothetical protein